jgi:two-component system CheB/CheR fusion protein
VRSKPGGEPAHVVPGTKVHSVVGIGASAGGLEAFSQLLQSLDPETGMAFVFVQHLAPKHESFLPELLATHTSLPVAQVEDGALLLPNRVYVIPPNVHMNIAGARLRLFPRPEGRTQYMPIDAFFRSLASWADGSSIGVVLSGTASDGAQGLREIKSVGGITMVQDPATAKYDGMPRAAIATDHVDFVLPPAGIAAELLRISRHPTMKAEPKAERPDVDPPDSKLQRVYQLLRKHVGVDFSQYKVSTMLRRLQRRMVLHRIANLDEYVQHLENDVDEVRALYEDILIHVTCFFREHESFAALQDTVLPQLIQRREPEEPLRFWVPGCSTGEEAYSLAIVTLERLGKMNLEVPVQIFATDISEAAVQKARAGLYSYGISADVPADLLRRYFTRSDGGYRVSKAVRDCCVFARQDVTHDPPFSKIDLVLCRNLLIYLALPLQRKLMQLFHYALKPGAYLMLGSAESVGAQADLFAVASKAHRIYQRKDSTQKIAPPIAHDAAMSRGKLAASRTVRPNAAQPPPLQQEMSQLLLSRYAPPGVVVDEEMRILQFRGQTGDYLAPAPGEASLSLFKMLREGLLGSTRSAIQEARKKNGEVRRNGIAVKSDGKIRKTDVVVVPIPSDGSRHFAVLFEPSNGADRAAKAPAGPTRSSSAPEGGSSKAVEQLRRELAASREYLESINQDLEAANEELQSANEEILSNNEELQSTNEELDTAKEEMQSANEELNTVNDELRGRNEELSRVNSDLVNLLGSVQIAIVMVGSNLRIRRFTPMAERVLNLIPSDVGRPLTDLKTNLAYPELDALVTEVIDTMAMREVEVKDREGRAYTLRVRPYKNLENRVDGAVLALFEVDRSVQDLERTRDFLHMLSQVMDAASEPLAVIDEQWIVRAANESLLRLLRLGRRVAIGRSLDDFVPSSPASDEFRRRLRAMPSEKAELGDVPLQLDVPDVGRHDVLVSVRPLGRIDPVGAAQLLAFRDLKSVSKAGGEQSGRG